ncbi:DUF6538 domain-containing protein [Phenylobacterium sp. SCN 70-31]|uniref:DUF6538 domain-containing protein n=1 Tax=Phenylobacterium sp. SCN 70-31 TaxID=1660129 RepID=UPI00086EDC24|nr:DUF6538 domain-containing protein [Phenylobacterium sp. SCN 70-31]ODT85947.1 MAG: hypothetical protein ABS78_18605 [Phenylobacterium sp. SCN 70-31]
MARYPGLTLQRNTYIARIVVPADVRRIIGKRELIQSLQTGDYKEAVKRWGPVHKAFKEQIARARAKGEAPKLDTQAASNALTKWGMMVMREPVDLVEPETETPWLVARQIAAYDRASQDPDAWHLIPNFDEMAAYMLTKGGLRTRVGDPIIAAMRGEIATYLAYAARHVERQRLVMARESFTEAAKLANLDDVGVMPERPSQPLPAPSMTLQKLHDEWMGAINVSEKERGRLDHQIRRLIEFVGDIPANHLSKDQIRDFMATVARIPRRRSARLHVLPIRKMIETFERENSRLPEVERIGTLTATTVREWYGAYRRMYDYAVAMGRLDDNPFEKLKSKFVVKGAESVKRRAYTPAEITAIFTKPMFQGFDGDGKAGYRHKPGTTLVRDAKYWLPILALFHGGRLSEMAAARLELFRCVKDEANDNIWFFDLTTLIRVKNDGSKRIVPLHPHMIELGWLDYVQARREAGDRWLFPELNHDSKYGAGHEFSKWWGNWCDKNGFPDRTITHHSWRHTWKRRARQSPVKEEMHDVLSGHKGTTVSRGYGEGADIEPLARDMALITFPEFPALPIRAEVKGCDLRAGD